ncbi:MAG: methyl-accepting chemotaxis protein, partial [Cyanobacteria bacterium P01_F01_bin.143]
LGTFLGITINLATLSQTITQVDITDLNSLIEELDKPLQGMGVAFVSSLIAISCSALLTVINLIWNTHLAKTTLMSFIEDYLDNIYLPQRQETAPIDIALERFSNDFGYMLNNLSSTIENSITNAFSKIENTAQTFESAANTLEQSRFPEKLSSATTDLAIAQNQFSQSSLVLQRSTQSFEHSLDGIQKVINKISEIEGNIEQINKKYDNLIELSKNTNEIN